MSDFFDLKTEFARRTALQPRRSALRDALFDARIRLDAQLVRIYREAAAQPPQRVLVVGVEVPERGSALSRIAGELARSRHHVTVSLVAMQPKGKFENVADAIANAPQPLDFFDWLVITDDDVALPPDFTDRFLALADRADLTVAQPAHRFGSHASYAVTQRKFGTRVRQSGFVEIGPLTVIRADGFADLIPFPPSRWAYGIDVLWAQIAADRGWKMGIVDALPIRHLSPIAQSYNMHDAVAEGQRLLASAGVTLRRSEILLDKGELLPG